MARQAAKIELSVRLRAIVERIALSRTESQRLVERMQIVLRSANGDLCVETARALGVDKQRVQRWRKRFAREREVLTLAEAAADKGDLERKVRDVLDDKNRSGTPPKFTPEQVSLMVALACHKRSELGLPLSSWLDKPSN